MQILDDDHLSKLTCSYCHKYLSVLPVQNCDDGNVKCGRCVKIKKINLEDEEHTKCGDSLFNLTSKQLIFKCVNRYEGCRKLLRVEDVEDHETRCIGTNVTCPKCNDDKPRSILDLICHFKFAHHTNYLTKNSFQRKLNEKDALIYVKDDAPFVILYQYLSDFKVLYIAAVCLTEIKVEQTFTVMTDTFGKTTEKKPCRLFDNFKCDDYYEIEFINTRVDAIKIYFDLEVKNNHSYSLLIPSNDIIRDSSYTQTLKEDDVFTVRLTEEFKKNYPDYVLSVCGTSLWGKDGKRIDLTCSNCKYFTGFNVYTCSKSNHVVCWDCKNWCAICNCSVKGWNSFLASINELLLFPCRWKCGKVTADVRSHEHGCLLKKML